MLSDSSIEEQNNKGGCRFLTNLKNIRSNDCERVKTLINTATKSNLTKASLANRNVEKVVKYSFNLIFKSA